MIHISFPLTATPILFSRLHPAETRTGTNRFKLLWHFLLHRAQGILAVSPVELGPLWTSATGKPEGLPLHKQLRVGWRLVTAFWMQTVQKATSNQREDPEAGKGPEREECAMPPETLAIPGLCHSGWDAGGLLVGCQGQQHMERPRHAGRTQPSRAGGSCSGWDPGHNPQREAQHVCRLRRLLGARSPASPSNTFLLQPPIYCRQDQLLEMAVSFVLIPQTLHTAQDSWLAQKDTVPA